MHLALDVSWTQVETLWRDPGSWVGPNYPDIGLFEEIARTAERGLFDMIFFGDGTGIPNTWKDDIEDATRWGVAWPRLDMSPWIALMARVTSHVGFGLTYSSTFMDPYYTARLLNSLDHVTNGRMAFNVITSQRRSDYQNYGHDGIVDHETRYERMEEFVDVCKALWASVEPGAFVWDRKTGQVADPAKVKPIHHKGRFFKVRGPLNVVPSPQGRPVMIQAGGSPRGTRAAAHVADHVFAATKSLALMAKQRADLDTLIRDDGRDPEQVGIVWATKAIVAETTAEAEAMKEQLIAKVPREAVGVWLSHNSGFDMSTLPERFTLRELQQRIIAANASPVGFVGLLIAEHGEDGEVTRNEFYHHGLRAATGYANTRTGTAAQIADRLEEVFEATGSRGGFMLSHSQGGPRVALHNFVTQLIPELQRRGRFRSHYSGRNLRENLAS
jgi:FMN-dependent oxidoreductase (nitrilotriacetate monooxygenase family)